MSDDCTVRALVAHMDSEHAPKARKSVVPLVVREGPRRAQTSRRKGNGKFPGGPG